jgi:hypothetical protein
MGILKKIAHLFGSRAAIRQLPAGSFTVNRDGLVITTTVSSTYPKTLLDEIGRAVQALFHEARTAHLPFGEVSIHFGSLRVTARELRGGTIIFLQPQSAHSQPPT